MKCQQGGGCGEIGEVLLLESIRFLKKNKKTCKSVWEDRQMNEMSKRGIV